MQEANFPFQVKKNQFYKQRLVSYKITTKRVESKSKIKLQKLAR